MSTEQGPKNVELHETGCIAEIWLVQMTRGGAPLGWYQFFHPNEAAARAEAERLRTEVAWLHAEFHVCRFVLAEVSS